MARKNGKLIIYIILGAVSIVGAYTAIVFAWGDQITQDKLLKSQITTESAAREKLETDGCKPAKGHKIDIAVVENNIKAIRKDVSSIETEQRALREESKESFKELLKEIKKK